VNILSKICDLSIRDYRLTLQLSKVNAPLSINIRLLTQRFNDVTRSTQPSTVSGMVKWVSAFALSSNKLQ